MWSIVFSQRDESATFPFRRPGDEGDVGAEWRDLARRWRTSATRPCSSPTTTSARDRRPIRPSRRRSTSPRSPRWRRPPRSPRRFESAAGCSASTTTCPRCWPRKRRRSTCSPTAASSSASAPVGAIRSTRPMGITFEPAPRRVDKLEEVSPSSRRTGRATELDLSGEHVEVERLRRPTAAGPAAAARRS